LASGIRLADLGVQRLYVDRRHRGPAAARTEHIRSATFKLRFLCRDLIENIELLGKLRQGLVALDRGKCHLCFEGGCVVPTRSSRHGLSRFAGTSVPAVRQKFHLSSCPNFRSRLYFHACISRFAGECETAENLWPAFRIEVVTECRRRSR
jgi:hypothetical protein